MIQDINLNTIESALEDFKRGAEDRRWNASGYAYDRAKSDDWFAGEALKEMRKLREVWPRARDALKAQERAYDVYVTTYGQGGDSGGCSCHINPPCSYCIEQSEIEEEERLFAEEVERVKNLRWWQHVIRWIKGEDLVWEWISSPRS